VPKLLYWGASAAAIALTGAYVVARVLRHPHRIASVPGDLTTEAVIPGIPGARYFVGVGIESFIRDVVAARQHEEEFLVRSGHTGPLPPADMLAISGGGDNGAFAAGLLCAWTDAGTRPTFKSVTGVSTGALIAPLAYLGSEYDGLLRSIYTSIAPADIAEKRTILAAVNNDAMADNRPLWSLISRSIDQKMLSRIAEEHRKGRILLVGTTNLDARQPVVWNIGKFAASGDPGALELCRSTLLASAAVPGAFPPSMIRVEADGKAYEEMHVDGGASAQVFLYPPSTRATAKTMGLDMSRAGRVYVIRNSTVSAAPSPIVKRQTISIAGRAIQSLIHTQGFGDLYRIYLTTQRDGFDFNLAYIGRDFKFEHKEEFDTPYMRALFDYGYNFIRQEGAWTQIPPGLETTLGL